MNPTCYRVAFGVFMDSMQGSNHQLPQGNDIDNAISLVQVLSRYHDNEVIGDREESPFL